MRARVFVMVFVAALLSLHGEALAKGADQATVDGDGMVAPITIEGTEGSDDDLGTLADVAGFWPAAFRQTPDPMLSAAPQEDLGPKLVITWRLPDGGPTPAMVRQELYRYAEGGPLTYTAPDQPLSGGGRTTGGWFRTPAHLEPRWDTFDLPDRGTLEGAVRPAARELPPTRDPASDQVPWLAIVAVVSAICGVGVLASRFTSGRRVRVGAT